MRCTAELEKRIQETGEQSSSVTLNIICHNLMVTGYQFFSNKFLVNGGAGNHRDSKRCHKTLAHNVTKC